MPPRDEPGASNPAAAIVRSIGQAAFERRRLWRSCGFKVSTFVGAEAGSLAFKQWRRLRFVV
jgi:hypothetical protein